MREGITDFLLEEHITRELENEKKGWVDFSKKENWYEVSDEYILDLPHPKQSNEDFNWERHAKNFELILEKLKPLAGKKVLDVGAGRPWSTRAFAREGAEAVALDILADKKVGLGAADVMMTRDKKFFERVLGDMNNLPFRDEAFDIVFFTGALHHSNELFKTLSECARVLKKGGEIGLTNEACTGVFGRELVGKPTKYGINEHNYKYVRYLYYLKKLGFSIRPFQEATFYEKHGANPSNILSTAAELKRYALGGVLILAGEKK